MFRWSQRTLGKSKLVGNSHTDPNISFLFGFSESAQDGKRYPQPTLFFYRWEYRAMNFIQQRRGEGRKEVVQDG